MRSLFYVKFNWKAFALVALLFRVLVPELDWLAFFAVLISIHQFVLLFNSLGSIIPIRYLFGALMCLQFFIGPTIAYYLIDPYSPSVNRVMKIPEFEYFIYVLPAVILFILGLHARANKLEGEILNQEKIRNSIKKCFHAPYVLIAIGFVSSFISTFFSSDLAFLFYLMGGLKFIGLFIIIIGDYKLKMLPLIIVIGSIISSSLGAGMFHDLMTWLMFCGAIISIKQSPSLKVKLALSIVFIIGATILQSVKGNYRESTWQKGENAGLEAFTKAYESKSESNDIFNLNSLLINVVRINQGFILTNIMSTVPSKVSFSNGQELMQILEAAFLPRIVAPNKLTAGNREIFTKYSGMQIRSGTSMALSSVGDAYINFGLIGGCIFMFMLGLSYSEVLKIFYRYSIKFPILLLFTPLVFYYPIRPDCELQTILGHLVKSCFLIFVIFLIWKKYFIVYPQALEKDIHTDTLVPASL